MKAIKFYGDIDLLDESMLEHCDEIIIDSMKKEIIITNPDEVLLELLQKKGIKFEIIR